MRCVFRGTAEQVRGEAPAQTWRGKRGMFWAHRDSTLYKQAGSWSAARPARWALLSLLCGRSEQAGGVREVARALQHSEAKVFVRLLIRMVKHILCLFEICVYIRVDVIWKISELLAYKSLRIQKVWEPRFGNLSHGLI